MEVFATFTICKGLHNASKIYLSQYKFLKVNKTYIADSDCFIHDIDENRFILSEALCEKYCNNDLYIYREKMCMKDTIHVSKNLRNLEEKIKEIYINDFLTYYKVMLFLYMILLIFKGVK